MKTHTPTSSTHAFRRFCAVRLAVLLLCIGVGTDTASAVTLPFSKNFSSWTPSSTFTNYPLPPATNLSVTSSLVEPSALMQENTNADFHVVVRLKPEIMGSPMRINNNGTIIGMVTHQQCFVWSEKDGFRAFGLSGGIGEVRAINDKDQWVCSFGISRNVFGFTKMNGYIWTQEKESAKLKENVKGSDNIPLSIIAVSINKNGTVVGDVTKFHTKEKNERNICTWNEKGELIQEFVNFKNSGKCYAMDINNDGMIVGNYSEKKGSMRSFLINQKGEMMDIGTLGGKLCISSRINSSAWIVGYSTNLAEKKRAFLWKPDIGMVDLGTLGGGWSEAMALNNHGQIIGFSETSKGKTHAFLWTEKKGMIDLGVLGREEGYAYDINDKGQILGEIGKGEDREVVLWEVVSKAKRKQ